MKHSNKIKDIFKGATIYSFSQMLAKSSAFFLLPLYTRVLTKSENGIIGYINTTYILLSVLISLGYQSAQTRFYFEKKSNGIFMFSNNIFILFNSIIVSGLVLLITKHFGIYSLKNGFAITIILLIAVILNVLSQNVINLELTKRNYVKTSIMQIIVFASSSIFTIVLITYFRMSCLGRVVALFFGNLLFSLIYVRKYFEKLEPVFSIIEVKKSVKFGLPITFHLFASMSLTYLDRFILLKYVTMDEIGLYTIGYTVYSVFSVVLAAFNQSYQPNFIGIMKSGIDVKETVRRIFFIWNVLCLIILLSLNLFLNRIILLIIGAEYSRIVLMMPWLIAGFYSQGLYYFFTSILFYNKKTYILPLLTIVSLLINIVANIILIPIYGITGASMATFVAYLCLAILAFIVSRKVFNFKWDICFPTLILILTMIKVVEIVSYAKLILLTISIFPVIYTNKDNIAYLLYNLKKNS